MATQRLLLGLTVCQVDGKTYHIKEPSAFDKLISGQIYKEYFDKAISANNFSDNELAVLLTDFGFWTLEEESRLGRLVDEVPELKIKLYELLLRTTERQMVRDALRETRKQIDELSNKKHMFDYLTCTGLAQAAKSKFLTGCSIFYPSGKPYWKSHKGWERPDELIDRIVVEINKNSFSDTDIREIARTEPWRSLWNSRESCGRLFDISSSNLSDAQKQLVIYSGMYDNIYESGEVSDEVINDDDTLDGWMLIRKREREKDQAKSVVDEKIGDNPRIVNADEIFVKADTQKDAQQIIDRNDIAGKVGFTKIMKQVKEEGVVDYMELRDTREQIMNQRANK